MFGIARMIEHQARQGGFALGGRLQKRARRQRHLGTPDFQQRLRGLRHQFAMPGDAREFVFLGDAGQRGGAPGSQRAGAAHIHVHTGIGRRHLDVERLVRGLQNLGDRPGCGNRTVETGRENRAAVDGDDVVRARRRETDFQNILGAAPRMQRGAPAALPMRVDDVARPVR